MSKSLENKKEWLLLYQCIRVFLYVVLLAGYGGLDIGLVAVYRKVVRPPRTEAW